MKKVLLFCMLISSMTFASGIKIENAWVKAVPKGATMSAAYFEIFNENKNAVDLIRASSTYSETVEIHTHLHEDGIMKMRQVPKLTIKGNGKTILRPMSDHIMFIGLRREIKKTEVIDLTLEFSNGDKIDLKVPVKKL